MPDSSAEFTATAASREWLRPELRRSWGEFVGPGLALVATVFLRVACHTYQDPFHLAAIAVLFSIYAAFYWYVRKLWPLIFAHLLLDIISVSAFKLLRG